MQAADRAGPDHHDRVALADAREVLPVDHAGERFRKGRLGVAHAVRDPVQPIHRQDVLRHAQVLRETAVEPHQHILWTRFRHLSVLHPQVAGGVEPGHLHWALLVAGGATVVQAP